MNKLRNKTIFVGLEDAQISRILTAAKTHHVPAGQYIVHENEPGDTMYVIVVGRVEIIHECGAEGGAVVASLSGGDNLFTQYEGDFFGEMALLDIEPRSASVKAVEDCTLISFTKDSLGDLFADDYYLHIVLLGNIARILSHRLRRTMHKNG